MSIRYSGDTEIRLGYDPKRRAYRGTVTDPYLRFRGEVPALPWRKLPRERGEFRHTDPTSSSAYDSAARRLAELADAWARSAKRAGKKRRSFMLVRKGKNKRIAIMRVFHAPCPIEDL